MTGFRPILGLVLRYLFLVALLLVFLWKFPPAGKDYSSPHCAWSAAASRAGHVTEHELMKP